MAKLREAPTEVPMLDVWTAWTQAAWQLPLAGAFGWWQMLSTMPNAFAHHAHHSTDTAQLPVPDPIEEEGEHALFA